MGMRVYSFYSPKVRCQDLMTIR